MGGQSAVHEIFSPEALQRSSQPQKYIADSPPVLGRFYQRQFQSVGSVKNSTADGPPGYRGQSANGQKGAVGQTRFIRGVPLTLLHQTAHIVKKALSLSLSSTWGDDKVKAFWRGSWTVRAHPRTLLKIEHHVLSVF